MSRNKRIFEKWKKKLDNQIHKMYLASNNYQLQNNQRVQQLKSQVFFWSWISFFFTHFDVWCVTLITIYSCDWNLMWDIWIILTHFLTIPQLNQINTYFAHIICTYLSLCTVLQFELCYESNLQVAWYALSIMLKYCIYNKYIFVTVQYSRDEEKDCSELGEKPVWEKQSYINCK